MPPCVATLHSQPLMAKMARRKTLVTTDYLCHHGDIQTEHEHHAAESEQLAVLAQLLRPVVDDAANQWLDVAEFAVHPQNLPHFKPLDSIQWKLWRHVTWPTNNQPVRNTPVIVERYLRQHQRWNWFLNANRPGSHSKKICSKKCQIEKKIKTLYVQPA